VLVTAHRRESFGAPLREAFGALRETRRRFPTSCCSTRCIRTRTCAARGRSCWGHPRIRLTRRSTTSTWYALRHAALAITDSGGIQEEAPSFGTPVLVLREVTERPEAVEAGVARAGRHGPGPHRGAAWLLLRGTRPGPGPTRTAMAGRGSASPTSWCTR
jgi:UDP-N-acetylglucosamine 2-epimerase (non-hydrolysing)